MRKKKTPPIATFAQGDLVYANGEGDVLFVVEKVDDERAFLSAYQSGSAYGWYSLSQLRRRVRFAQTEYGFEYEQAIVQRLHRRKDGSVLIGVSTQSDPYNYLQVNVSATGKVITVYGHGYDGAASKTRRKRNS